MKYIFAAIILFSSFLSACDKHDTIKNEHDIILSENQGVQNLNLINYSDYAKTDFLNDKQRIKREGGTEEITYLGPITDEKKNVLYYVLTSYSQIPAAMVDHGSSKVIFIDPNSSPTRQYVVGTPEELPFKLEENYLYFHDSEKEIFTNIIGIKLPKNLCVSTKNCYAYLR